MEPGLTRRHAVGGIAAGLSLPLLAACGGDDSGDAVGGDPSGEPATPGTSSSSSAPGGESATATTGLVASADVPEGSGVILDDLVVTQPEAGTFKAFSATCTHQGCKVSSIDTSIHCACHGSQFSISDGSVEVGPATEPLAETPISVEGGQVTES